MGKKSKQKAVSGKQGGKSSLFQKSQPSQPDPVSEAVEEVVAVEGMRNAAAAAEVSEREALIAQTYRMMGRIETADMFGKLATVASLVWAKQVKDSKIYKDIPELGTWASFCNLIGKSRRHMDEQIQNLNIFGGEFLATVASFSLGYKDLRKLRGAITDGTISVSADLVQIGDEMIPMDAEYAEDLQAAIETVIEEKEREIEERDTTLKAKDRVLEEKEKVIFKQETEIEKQAEKLADRGLSGDEGEFIKAMENTKSILVGIALKLSHGNLPGGMTPLMRAAYVETIGPARQPFAAYHDEAVDLFGEANSEWTPPTE